MKDRSIIILTSIAVIATSIFGTLYSVQQDQISSEEIISAGQEGDKKIQDAIDKVDQKQAGLLEWSLTDFQPELLYRVSFFERDDQPNAIHVKMENTGNHHTAVRNTWTITGDYCSDNDQHHGGPDAILGPFLSNLTKQSPIVETKIPLPDFLFNDLEDRRSFLLMLELEMMPFTPSAGLVETLPVPRKTFIQFDHNEGEYPEWWMTTLVRGGEIKCDAEPSIWTHVNLNTTSIEHFNLWPR